MKIENDTESRRLEKRLNERFIKAMATYHLIEDDDHILVGLSGGKDSLLLLELLAKRAKIHHPRFEVEALHVRMENIHYETDTSYLQAFCDNLGVKLHIRTTSFEVDVISSAVERSLHSFHSVEMTKRSDHSPPLQGGAGGGSWSYHYDNPRHIARHTPCSHT